MRLSARLQALTHMIPSQYSVVDIGCDHALLDIYLTLNHKNHCIASDINQNVITNARNHIISYQLQDQIELIKSNGLENILPPQNAVLVIAGMGTSTILSILNNPKMYQFSYLIIQTNNEWEVLRKQLSLKGWKLVEEQIVLDKGKYYILMKWVKGNSHYSKKQCFLGPCLMHQKESQNYYISMLEKCCKIYPCIPFYHWYKKYQIALQIFWLKKELKILKKL